MIGPLKIYIPDPDMHAALSRLAPLLDFPADLAYHNDQDQVLELRSETPLRLGAILDWINVRATYENRFAALMPDTVPLRFGSFSARYKNFIPPNGEVVRLTDRECDFLGALYRVEGHIMTKSDLLNLVWGYVAGVETHTVETHLYRLRQKMERDAGNPENIITTDRGYQLVVE